MSDNEMRALKEQMECWKNGKEYLKIIDAIKNIPEEERDGDLANMLEQAYRDLKEENSEAELYETAEMAAVEEHISKCFGKFENVFHEIVSPDIHVDICVIPPSDDRNYYTLVTMGMGAHRMNVPEELAEYELERAELLVTLPPDWKLDQESMADETWYWPIRMLKSIARLPGEEDSWLGWGHTVSSNEGTAYAENTKLSAAMLIYQQVGEEEADICELPGGEKVNFYQLIPLYDEEVAFKCENDGEALLRKMKGISFVVDINRRNAMENVSTGEYSFHVTLKLNARFQPRDRHELEDALEEVLGDQELGLVDGGGTMQMSTGEIEYCDIEIYLKDGDKETLEELARIVNHLGVPKGSQLQAEGLNMSVGEQEGMAVYMNGTDLDEEVYRNCDINYAIEQMETLMEGIGRMYSYWEGPKDTALYFYGTSYEKMLGAVKGFLEKYPLCRKCVVKQIA